MRRRPALWLAWLAVLSLSVTLPLGVAAQQQEQQPETPTENEQAAPTPAEEEAAPDAAEAPAPSAPPAAGQSRRGSALPSGANVAIIRIEGTIYDFTLESLERRVERALNQGASIIVLELDTPGGVVKSALDISKYIKTIPVPTVAWVNNEAYSAGILIGSACDQMVMSPASATGDCAPILPGSDLPPTERAKQLTPILEEFRDNARDNGYDYSLFHAMCVLGVELYYIENPTTGERRLVNQADYRVMVGGMSIDEANEDVRRSVRGSGTGLSSLFRGQSGSGGQTQWDIAVPNCEIATAQARGQWQPVSQLPSGATLPQGRVHDGRTLLTLNQTRAEDISLSQATISNATQLSQHFKAGNVQHVGQTWSENLAGFLVNPIVRAVLVIALLLGLFFEFQSPGLGLGGAVAGVALLALLGAPFVVGMAEWWHVLVFFIGLGLLITELAFVPGFGVLGITGLIMMFAGLVLSAVPSGGGTPGVPGPQTWNEVVESAIFLLVGVFLSFVGIYVIARQFGNVPLLNRLVLDAAQQRAEVSAGAAMAGAGPMLSVSGDEMLGEGRIQVGDTGTVTTGLRPSGRAEIDGQIVDVVSYGQWIQPGQQVRVVEVHGNRIVVDEA
ncbi:MAG: NfeD family protein [Phycisphaeraceae bacterium]